MAEKVLLVTGGAGYIGSHFCKMAKKHGYVPVSYDNLSTGFEKLVKWGDFVKGDLRDYELLRKIFDRYKPVSVVHFSAYSQVKESMRDPYKYYENNVCSTLNLLKAIVDSNVENLIFSSTAAIFGRPETMPISENAPKNPINPYGKTKLVIENMLEDFESGYGLRYTSLRYFNVSGGDPDYETGECHNPETHLIPIVCQAALGIRDGIQIYGNDYNTRDGTCVRDYIHVVDLVGAHLLALDKMLETGKSQRINLGSNRGFSNLEIVKAAEKVVGHGINYTFASRAAGDPDVLICDNTFAREYLGWKIEFGDVEKHIEHAMNWQRRLQLC
jgi:UDP-glucose-4-epimerase GalE